MKQYKNVTFNPKLQTATDIINRPENIGLEYVETKYINEYEAVVIFRYNPVDVFTKEDDYIRNRVDFIC